MASSVIPQPPPAAGGNGAALGDVAGLVSPRRDAPRDPGPRSPLLARLTGVTSVAIVAAAGLIVVGVLAVLGGTYAKQVVRDQLVPQKIFFPVAGSPALLPGVKQYAGQQLVTGDQAKAYANNFIAVHLSKIAAGQTYAQVSAASLAAPADAKLASAKAALFQGETLRGLLLGAWGWAMVGAIITIAGIVLIGLGGVLFLLPVANWQVNLRGRPATAGRA
ncbi:MAG: hypothetical protein QOE44_2763 [Solirubrobacteraceae bacterium]|nr:hypothetical protein [Solirubrobacteraceae bacterium]